MMKNAKSILFSLASMALITCETKMPQIESPLAIVTKLISAESLADFQEAKKYIDVEKVYSKYKDTLSAEQAWKNEVLFFYNIGKDKKFTNIFRYYDYIIKEEYEGENAKVVFESIHPEQSVSKIIYTLTRHDKTWEVVGIEYIKR
jgi:hypothetical protein